MYIQNHLWIYYRRQIRSCQHLSSCFLRSQTNYMTDDRFVDRCGMGYNIDVIVETKLKTNEWMSMKTIINIELFQWYQIDENLNKILSNMFEDKLQFSLLYIYIIEQILSNHRQSMTSRFWVKFHFVVFSFAMLSPSKVKYITYALCKLGCEGKGVDKWLWVTFVYLRNRSFEWRWTPAQHLSPRIFSTSSSQ